MKISKTYSIIQKVHQFKNQSWNIKLDCTLDKPFEVSISSLMQLLKDKAHDVSTIKHTLEKIKEAIFFLNPTQSPVVNLDQPLFA